MNFHPISRSIASLPPNQPQGGNNEIFITRTFKAFEKLRRIGIERTSNVNRLRFHSSHQASSFVLKQQSICWLCSKSILTLRIKKKAVRGWKWKLVLHRIEIMLMETENSSNIFGGKKFVFSGEFEKAEMESNYVKCWQMMWNEERSRIKINKSEQRRSGKRCPEEEKIGARQPRGRRKHSNRIMDANKNWRDNRAIWRINFLQSRIANCCVSMSIIAFREEGSRRLERECQSSGRFASIYNTDESQHLSHCS